MVSLVAARMHGYTLNDLSPACFQAALYSSSAICYATDGDRPHFPNSCYDVSMLAESRASGAGSVGLHPIPGVCNRLSHHIHSNSVTRHFRSDSVLGSASSRKLVCSAEAYSRRNKQISLYNIIHFRYISKYRQFCCDSRVYSNIAQNPEASC